MDNLVKQLEDASSQVEVMRETVIKSKQEQDKLQGANTKIQFELAEQRRLASELKKGAGLCHGEAERGEEEGCVHPGRGV